MINPSTKGQTIKAEKRRCFAPPFDFARKCDSNPETKTYSNELIALHMFINIAYGFTNSSYLLGFLIRNFTLKFFFKSHN